MVVWVFKWGNNNDAQTNHSEGELFVRWIIVTEREYW